MNNKLTDERIKELLDCVEMCEDMSVDENAEMAAALIELQERRKVDSEPVAPKTLPCSVELNPGLIIGRGCKTETLLTALKRRADYYAELESMTPEQRAEHDAGIAEFKAMLGHSVITDTPPVPVVPEEMNFSTACNFVQINGMAKEERTTLAMRAWNACRAAMLNGGKS